MQPFKMTLLSHGRPVGEPGISTHAVGASNKAYERSPNRYLWTQALVLSTIFVAHAWAASETPKALPTQANIPMSVANAQTPVARNASDNRVNQGSVSAGGLTLEGLANAQRQKLAAELEKGKSVNEMKPANTNPPVTKTTKRKPPDETVARGGLHALVVVATYGTPNNPRAEVQFNGVTRVVSPNTALGPATIEAIGHGQVRVTLAQQQNPASYTLQPGQRLDF